MSITHAAPHCAQSHTFASANPLAEHSTRKAVILTVVMMVVELIGGWTLNSMALLADGWHMSSHALALGLALFAYRFARRNANDVRFTFGTWKVEVLGGYTSAMLLLGVAGLMAFQSVERLFSPKPIQYQEATVIAVIGLLVNLICAWWLRDSHSHAHGHGHHHGHGHEHAHDGHGHGHHDGHADLNLRAAYLHVVADAATSVLAIVALVAGMHWGVTWMDPIMGIVGAVLVTAWAWGLLRSTGRVLLDAEMDAPVVEEVKQVIAELPHAIDIGDLHVWRVGSDRYACVVSLITAADIDAKLVREALQIHEELVHITVELQRPALHAARA
ncbi:Cadmium, cobalt and zinc/H(+)-K(+) antiporter [Xanthomonas hortorum pv. vitians]|uniref:CDF family Co(II)/Ni(II) efflux transporter DmeF n=1 Tax=Xanthomonas hortorum pv. vitians TaxID=83224 RepID=A0A6V7CAE2_9XANT|nr:CDF family Co(II)/Ni(II) efflux transporter DmeF [Xanthomonas hortorum]MCE4303357.1 CDF family Co(II)/Ni(II) efflux transporter DmeF [Xanthomonas hortorum pv. vitians]MDT7822796.1 CDF family Co(II)/Ni(II) efflux transporter DmeF [Xanthomonas hortorum pv. vitians]MDV7249604.1 CDF family Co(II)/Ni(II) efflux transporter DmeF [Xanthomonas hortorum pv. vitians]NMI29216.1 cation transporter [Xanthomonas hortorum pv. vitians]CAD0311101.1 Cadmium, cobalt and zinc/H(+)-K(+) antiporter [Xanthomonas 